MSRSNSSARSQPYEHPWGRSVGLLTACIVTIVGVYNGIGPEEILMRALWAGVIVGIVCATAAVILKKLRQEV